MDKIKKSIQRIVQYFTTHSDYKLDEEDYDFLLYAEQVLQAEQPFQAETLRIIKSILERNKEF